MSTSVIMHHIAILKKSCVRKGDNLLTDILTGIKTIESRWYINKVAPWNQIEIGDDVYFKESGSPIRAKAKVSYVIQYDDLDSSTISRIISTYGSKIAPSSTQKELDTWSLGLNKKRYCILIFLTEIEKVEPFEIDKTGFGSACAWMVTSNIDKITKTKI